MAINGTNAGEVIAIVADPVVNALGGDDAVIGATSNDTINGDNGNDLLMGIMYDFAGLTGTGTEADPYLLSAFAANSGNDSINGGNGDDTIFGADGDDILSGGDGNDGGVVLGYGGQWFYAGLYGGDGNDQMSGGAGNDDLYGGAGNDIMMGDQGQDYLEGGSGNNVADGGTGVDTLYIGANLADVQLHWTAQGDIAISGMEGGVAFKTIAKSIESFNFNGDIRALAEFKPLDIIGTEGNDTLNGTAQGEMISGLSGKDIINAGDNDDKLVGGSGKDTLNGGNGNDWLFGGRDKDNLTGGAGADTFVFDTLQGKKHADKIMDFSVADDTLAFDNAIFTALADGPLAAGMLAFGKKAMDANDHIIYNQSNGKLYYDADGAGGAKAKLVANIGAGHMLTEADFLVI